MNLTRQRLDLCVPSADVWFLEYNNTDASLTDRLVASLPREDTKRLTHMRVHGARLQRLLSRYTLRQVLSLYCPVSPNDWVFRYGVYGKLEIAGPRSCQVSFNISHTQGMVACVVGTADVGIDIEQTTREVSVDSLARLFTERESRYLNAVVDAAARRSCFFQYWTLKEACSKAIGRGLTMPFNTFFVELGSSIVWLPKVPGVQHNRCYVTHYWPSSQHLIAVAIVKDKGLPLTVTWNRVRMSDQTLNTTRLTYTLEKSTINPDPSRTNPSRL